MVVSMATDVSSSSSTTTTEKTNDEAAGGGVGGDDATADEEAAATSATTAPDAADPVADEKGGSGRRSERGGGGDAVVSADDGTIGSCGAFSDTDSDDDELAAGTGGDGDGSNKNDAILVRATLHKETGNGHFQKCEYDKAARSYRRGCHAVSKLGWHNDEQVSTLYNSLQTNLSTVLFKTGKYRQSVHSATQVVVRIEQQQQKETLSEETPSPSELQSQQQQQLVKALYRRAAAERKMGDLDDARKDLRRALELDPANAACKKELASVRRELEATSKKQKAALAKAFASSAPSLYGDKEKEEKEISTEKDAASKEDEEKAKIADKKRLEEELKRQKQEWEDECVKRMASGGPAISFEEWQKEQEEEREREERDRLERDRKKKEEERKRKEEMRKKAAAEKKEEEDDSDSEHFTESELAQMRGYKKTADGRVTSYFTRELSAEEKAKLEQANAGPKRLDGTADASGTSPSSLTAPLSAAVSLSPASSAASGTISSVSKAGPSVWNQAGTWEEKDTTTFCTEQLRKRLLETCCPVTETEFAKVSKFAKDLDGHASIVVVKGKKRYIYEYSCRLEYEVFSVSGTESGGDGDDDGKSAVVSTGKVHLPDICSTAEEVEMAWEGGPATNAMPDLRSKLAEELQRQVARWVQDFHERY